MEYWHIMHVSCELYDFFKIYSILLANSNYTNTDNMNRASAIG